MKNSFKRLPGSKIELEVTLDQKEFLPYYEKAHSAAMSQVHLKGFRPGAAPKELAAGAVDKEAVFEAAAKEAIRHSLDEVSEENNWTLIDTPNIAVEDAELGIKYKATLTVFPEVKLGNYTKIAHKVMGDKKEQKVEADEVEKTLTWLREQRKEGDKVPELNDDFAKTVGNFKTVEELKKSVNEGILLEKQFKERDRLRIKILEEIVKASEIDIPEIMVQKTFDGLNKQWGPMLKASGKTEEQVKTDLMEKAKNNVASNLVIYRLAQAEQLEPTKEEVEGQEAHMHAGAHEHVGESQDYQYNYGMLLNEKVYAFLEKQ